ncbi:MAG: cupredoxin domain-containing protein [Limimaricola sp.]|uniref:cupredoxin domain-containing protein n=1 Tax=Limimaricola sp. TaxID=2211665 RepID=UPI001DA987E4|nr:cupredoxin domain-containing protein [Limimaricola sp.]MBI1415840.1 cupredoxin domain-containing protein [Limimaricola sp.]
MFRVLFKSLLVALALAAPAALRAEGDAPLVIEMTDGVVAPQRLELAAGATVTIVVRNTGTTAAEFESKRLRKEIIVAPGTETQFSLRGLPAGEYDFVDEFHEDMDSAHGVIVVGQE